MEKEQIQVDAILKHISWIILNFFIKKANKNFIWKAQHQQIAI